MSSSKLRSSQTQRQRPYDYPFFRISNHSFPCIITTFPLLNISQDTTQRHHNAAVCNYHLYKIVNPNHVFQTPPPPTHTNAHIGPTFKENYLEKSTPHITITTTTPATTTTPTKYTPCASQGSGWKQCSARTPPAPHRITPSHATPLPLSPCSLALHRHETAPLAAATLPAQHTPTEHLP